MKIVLGVWSIYYTLISNNLIDVKAIILKLNESEYSKLPSLFELDNYKRCMLEADGKYCIVNAELYTETPSQLYDVIKNYSAFSQQHFNHTRIHRGICYTNCYKHPNLTLDDNIEGCLNATIYDQYDLQVRLLSVEYCDTAGQTMPIDVYCYVVALVYLIIIVLNVAATVYDIKLAKSGQKEKKWLLAFSMKRNWNKLIKTDADDPRIERLKSIHGLRSLCLICVMMAHNIMLAICSYFRNTDDFESSYESILTHYAFNGNLLIQTFFILSAFLLSYNYLLRLEQCKLTFWDYPMGILMRWLRLAPVYILTIATVSTWVPYLGSGPMWRRLVTNEHDVCRKDWWINLLYLNNYFWRRGSNCLPQSWYLAADTQLFIWGLALVILGQYLNERNRRIMWILALIISFIPIPLQVYMLDLDAIVLHTPENFLVYFSTDPTFHYNYISFQANICSYTIALVAAIYYYNILKRNDNKLQNSKIFISMFYLSIVLGSCVVLSGMIWYRYNIESIILRVLYASMYKIIFALCVHIGLFGLFMKVEPFCRGILELNIWPMCGRLTYSAYLLHTIIQRPMFATFQRPIYITQYFLTVYLFASIALVFPLALLATLLVEMPFCKLQKLLFTPKPRSEHNIKQKFLTTIVLNDKQGQIFDLNINNTRL